MVLVLDHIRSISRLLTRFYRSEMGASESLLARQQQQQQQYQAPVDVITTVSERIEGVDPLRERIQALKIAAPLLKTPPPSDTSLTEILVRKHSQSPNVPGSLNPKVLLELFSMYREWQEEKAKKISQRQEDLENKIETADALAMKLLQRFNYSSATMRTTAHNLGEVHPLEIEVGELKGRLTEVISNCDALCKRIASEGPEALRSTVEPFSTSMAEPANGSLLQH